MFAARRHNTWLGNGKVIGKQTIWRVSDMKRFAYPLLVGAVALAFAPLIASAQEAKPAQPPPLVPAPAPAQTPPAPAQPAQDPHAGHNHSHDVPAAPGAQAASTAPAYDPANPPKLALNINEWDFGSKWYGEKCEGELVIKNEGKGPLKIVNIRSSCGCTVAKPKSGGVWQNKVLNPGESDTASLSYSTKKAAAKVNQTITIETNDPERPSFAFQVKGEVKQLFACTPADRITFPRIEKDAKSSQTIEMTSNFDKPLNLKLKPLPENARYEVKLETVEEGKKYKLTAATKPPLDLGANQLNVELETGVEANPTMSIPISAYVAPRVQVSPPKLFVSPKVAQPFTKIIRVTYQPDKPVKVTSVKSSHESIKAEVTPPANPPAANQTIAYHEIKVSLPAGKDIPTDNPKITIETDDPSPDYQKFTVDVVVRDVASAPVKPVTGDALKPQPQAPIPGAPAPGTPAPAPGTPAKPAEPAQPGKP
jgi:Protein of unknown function (DUF1573)